MAKRISAQIRSSWIVNSINCDGCTLSIIDLIEELRADPLCWYCGILIRRANLG